MDFGVHLPQIGWKGNRATVRDTAVKAEALGYASIWVSDHIAIPEKIATRYPLGDTGQFPLGPDVPWLDPLSTLCYAAAHTMRVRLGVSVLVLGFRPPVPTAKAIITLDALSEGRTILGAGAGWMPEEFAAVGMPFDHRGARADEQLQVFDNLFTEERPEHHGRFYEYERIGFNPKPYHGHIPIWVGGFSDGAYRRAGRYGDGFHGAYSRVEVVREQWAAVRQYAEEFGRDPATLELSTRVWLNYDAADRGDGALSESDDRMKEAVGAWAEIGVTHLVMDVLARGGQEGKMEAIQRFAENVCPHFRQ